MPVRFRYTSYCSLLYNYLALSIFSIFSVSYFYCYLTEICKCICGDEHIMARIGSGESETNRRAGEENLGVEEEQGCCGFTNNEKCDEDKRARGL